MDEEYFSGFPSEVSNFRDISPTEVLGGDPQLRMANIRLLRTQAEDYNWRIKNRPRFGWTLIGLLVAQNFAVFVLIFCAFFFNKLSSVQPIFSVLVTGTMASTAYSINIIIKWLFSNIDYKLHKN